MGIDYSINLYYPIELLEAVLLKLPAIAYITAGANTEIELPNGRCISLPFTSTSKDAPVQLKSIGSSITLDTSLMFDIDDPIWDYIRQGYSEDHLNQYRKQIPIGCIYLHIYMGNKNIEMAFTAAVSDMSRLFVNSKSIHNKFINFMRSTNGLFGLIDIEEGYFLLLTNPQKEVWPAGYEIETEFEPYYDIDLLIEGCLQQI